MDETSGESIENTYSAGVQLDDHPIADGPLPEFVDWILGLLIALAGLLSIVSGSALAFLIDRDLLAEHIEAGAVTVAAGARELSEEEQLELASAVVSWTGIGFLVTGIGMFLFGIIYIGLRHRAYNRYEENGKLSCYSTFALLGAFATGVLSFIPFSVAIGGAIAGYLERGESNRTVSIGAVSGLLAILPLLSLVVFITGGLVAGLTAIEEVGLAIVTGAAMLFVLMLVATIAGALGALGGYIGGQFAEHRARPK